MNTGQKISGLGHAGLIGVALFGGAFAADPLPFEVTEVTAISEEEYAALIAQDQSPEAVANVNTPEPPEAGETAPQLVSDADDAPEQEQPQATDAQEPDDAPDVSDLAQPVEAEVSDEPPVLLPPQEEVAALTPEVSEAPQPQDALRVAPEPVARPEPDVRVDEVEQQEVQPGETPDVVEDETEATAPEEATTEIVTEAEEPASAAPVQSVRPRTRPSRPEPEPETETVEAAPQPEETAVDNAVAAALNQANADAPRAPSGPPLTGGEKDALRVAVQKCWNVGSLSSEALNTTVVVAVNLSEDGKPQVNSIEMLSATGGSGSAAKQAYEAARRAIIRCGAKGFDLPVEKYDHWRDIEMTFNPERMRIK